MMQLHHKAWDVGTIQDRFKTRESSSIMCEHGWMLEPFRIDSRVFSLIAFGPNDAAMGPA